MRQNASLPGLLGGMKGLALEECTRRDPTQFHILVVAYRNTAHYSIKVPENRCLVRWASQGVACLKRLVKAEVHGHGQMLGANAPAKIQEVTLMRPIHGNL